MAFSASHIFLCIRKWISILCLIGLAGSAAAQQWVQFTQSDRYLEHLNPAYAGHKSQLRASVAHRSQYSGIHSPGIHTQQFSFSMPIRSEKWAGGMQVINDRIGYQNYASMALLGAYHISLKKAVVSFGGQVGLLHMVLKGEELRTPEGTYNNNEVVEHNDPQIPNVRVSSSAPTLTLGTTISFKNTSIGVAVQNIHSPRLELTVNQSETNIQIDRTIQLHYLGNFKVGVNMELRPTVLYKTDIVKHQLDTRLILHAGNFMTGLTYRGYSGVSNDVVGGEFGFKVKKNISIAYSYEYPVSFINEVSSGTHEISVVYKRSLLFSEKRKGNILYTPRYL